MSMVELAFAPAAASQSEEAREAKLKAAKQKLRKYRSSQASASSIPLTAVTCPAPSVWPLSTSRIGNINRSISATSKSQEGEMYGDQGDKPSNGGHGRQASMSGRHRRNGSVARSQGGFAPQGWSMPNAASSSKPNAGAVLLPPIPSDISTTPATPQLTSDEIPADPFAGPPLPPVSSGEEDVEASRQRFTSFSFGAKPPRSQASPLASPIPSPIRSNQHGLTSFPSQPGLSGLFGDTPDSSSTSNLSATPSRPPSLLFTAPSPLQSSGNQLDRPNTPPNERRKRHSHTRSSSISMPNLKLGRPTSLGIPTSPSYPGSPTSPIADTSNPRRSAPIIASKLKFEPSEAEKEKEEGRRKALEKLTGTSPLASPLLDEPQAAISLPEDDEDTPSTVRPLSGIYTSPTFSFGRPNSLTLPSLSSSISSTSSSTTTPYSWSAGEEVGATERWSFGQPKEEAFGYGLDMSKRASQTGTLAVLAEEDEGAAEAEGMVAGGEEKDTGRSVSAPTDVPTDVLPDAGTSPSASVHRPTPSKLRELHLVSSVSGSTPSRASSSIDSISTRPTSPTNTYASAPRGRPRPLSGIADGSISTTHSTPPISALVTPAGSVGMQRRQSRGSSISYKKEGSTSSTGSVALPAHRWSISSRDIISPPPEVQTKSSAAMRPYPPPASLAGLGSDGSGTARVLSRVSEKEEEVDPEVNRRSWRPEAAQQPESYVFQSFSSGPSSGRRQSHDSLGEDAEWREHMLEMQMERNTLREDVQGWKDRCMLAEERLEDEKKENGVLRERVRKLGDWLLSASNTSSTPTSAGSAEESRKMRELQDQLFAMTASLEQERKQREQAQARVAELERAIAKQRFEIQSQRTTETPSAPDSPFVATAAATPTRSPFISPSPSTNVTPAASTPDTNDQRMRAWGFPRGPIVGKKENKRESFFGLSRDLRGSPIGSISIARDQLRDDLGTMGVDLPPISGIDTPLLPVEQERHKEQGGKVSLDRRSQAGRWIDASASVSAVPPLARASEPNSQAGPGMISPEKSNPGFANSSSPMRTQEIAAVDPAHEPPWKANQLSSKIPWYARGSTGTAPNMGVGLDMRAACRCCRGEVMEV